MSQMFGYIVINQSEMKFKEYFSMTAEDKDNLYVCINTSDMRVPDLIRDRAVCIKGDIGEVLDRI